MLIASFIPVLLTGGREPTALILVGLAAFALFVVCKVVELYYDPLLQPEVTPQNLLDDALQFPWWHTESPAPVGVMRIDDAA